VNSQSVGIGPEIGKGRRDGRGEVDGFVVVQPAFAAGQGEQGFDQAACSSLEASTSRAVERQAAVVVRGSSMAT
jgi:hypothetical protein